MKKSANNQFEKVSTKTAHEIRIAAEELERTSAKDYNIRSNGNHIWVEFGPNRTAYWSPMLHIELEPALENKTFIKCRFGKNPIQWAVFTAIRLLGVFTISILTVTGFRKSNSGQDFSFELYGAISIFCLWLILLAIAQYHHKNDAPRFNELRNIAEKLAV